MKFKHVDNPETLFAMQDVRYCACDNYGILICSQEAGLDRSIVLAVVQHKGLYTLMPHFVLHAGAKNLTDSLFAFIVNKLSVIEDRPEHLEAVQKMLVEWGNKLGNMHEYTLKHNDFKVQYCNVDPSKVHRSLTPAGAGQPCG